MKIRLLGDKFAVITDLAPEWQGGIFIPEDARQPMQQGVVAIVGPGKKNDDGSLEPMPVEVGDHIIYSKYSGSEVKVSGQTFQLMTPDGIMCVLEDFIDESETE